MNSISAVLSAIHPSLATLQGVPLWAFLLVLALVVMFLLVFLVQGPRVWWQLRKAAKAARLAREANDNPDPDEIGNAFSSEPLKHIWEEYRDTLHPYNKAGSGASAVYEWRATVPADSMFTREVLVDSRLFDEFTRHLPGVLTGLGIIGTFAGLLTGLRGFKTSPIEEATLPALKCGRNRLPSCLENFAIAITTFRSSSPRFFRRFPKKFALASPHFSQPAEILVARADFMMA